jgi:DNA polymerase (family X)
MKNQEVSKILYEISNLLELCDDNVFKIRAYRRAGQAIDSLSKPVEEYAKSGKLQEIPGIGKAIAEKILEFLETGHLKYYESLKKKVPVDIESLRSVEGMGPKKIKLLYSKLHVKNIKDLEAVARSGKIRKIEGLGAKTEENIIRSINNSKLYSKRMLLGYALPIADEIVNYMKKSDIMQISVAGSLRRMKETIGDLDILITTNKPKEAIDHFCSMPGVANVIARGPTKASLHLNSGLQVDLRVLLEKEYGAALMYFTGSKEHNIELRKIAISRGMKLSEYGLFHKNKIIAGRSEVDVYKALGLDYIEPEMREVRGEIAAAKSHSLPNLIKYGDIRGDLHVHSTWSDGVKTLEEMALEAKNMGYDYICITDHVGKLKIANAMDEKRLEKQSAEIRQLNKKLDIKILQGAEIDIRSNGKFDVDNNVLKSLDIVIASLHSGLKGSVSVNTDRILKAMENPHVDIIGHPSGRLIDKRIGAEIDMNKIINQSFSTGTLLEIDSFPNRLDLNDINTKSALDMGCKIAIDTDAHNTTHLKYMNLGIAVARRAWARKSDVINTLPYKKFAKEFDLDI